MSDSEILKVKIECLAQASKYSTTLEELLDNYKKIKEAIGLPVSFN